MWPNNRKGFDCNARRTFVPLTSVTFCDLVQPPCAFGGGDAPVRLSASGTVGEQPREAARV